MDAFFETLSPADVIRLKELATVGYLAVFLSLGICRFLLTLVHQPAVWRSFFTSPTFLVSAASALVALVIYLQLPPTELGIDPVVFEDEVLWGLNKADAFKLIEIIILSVLAWVLIFFGVRPILNAAFNSMQSRFPAQSVAVASRPLGKGKLLFLATAFVGIVSFIWLSLTRNSFDKSPVDRIPATATEESLRLYGLTKLQLLDIAEIGVLATVAVLIVWLVIRPLFRRAVAAVLGIHSHGALRTVNWSAIAVTFVTVALSLWRVYEIASL